MCLLVSAWPALAAVPTPESYFAHPIGADRTVIDWEKVVRYFHALSGASDRIRVEELGETADGRPFIAATIADSATLKNLDRYREIQQRLADSRKTTPADAEKLIAEGKTVVLITCSIHATEIASTHTAVEYTYRLLTEDSPHNRAILKDVILILVPSLNPDGVDIVTRWYRKTLGTPYEGSNPPELYHKYVGHDNNRDYLLAAGDAAYRLKAAQRMASRDHLRRAPDGPQRGSAVRAALARSNRTEHRSDSDAGNEHDLTRQYRTATLRRNVKAYLRRRGHKSADSIRVAAGAPGLGECLRRSNRDGLSEGDRNELSTESNRRRQPFQSCVLQLMTDWWSVGICSKTDYHSSERGSVCDGVRWRGHPSRCLAGRLRFQGRRFPGHRKALFERLREIQYRRRRDGHLRRRNLRLRHLLNDYRLQLFTVRVLEFFRYKRRFKGFQEGLRNSNSFAPTALGVPNSASDLHTGRADAQRGIPACASLLFFCSTEVRIPGKSLPIQKASAFAFVFLSRTVPA